MCWMSNTRLWFFRITSAIVPWYFQEKIVTDIKNDGYGNFQQNLSIMVVHGTVNATACQISVIRFWTEEKKAFVWTLDSIFIIEWVLCQTQSFEVGDPIFWFSPCISTNCVLQKWNRSNHSKFVLFLGKPWQVSLSLDHSFYRVGQVKYWTYNQYRTSLLPTQKLASILKFVTSDDGNIGENWTYYWQ